MDEDLTMEKRRMRWRIVKAASRGRAKGRRVVMTNRELWVKGKRWIWDKRGKI